MQEWESSEMVLDERVFELTAQAMIAELEMRASIAGGDYESMSAWVRRGPEIRAHLRTLHRSVAESAGDTSPQFELARAALTGLAGTFSTLVTRHSSAVLRYR